MSPIHSSLDAVAPHSTALSEFSRDVREVIAQRRAVGGGRWRWEPHRKSGPIQTFDLQVSAEIINLSLALDTSEVDAK
jgi:hypothetical protein